jgi:hypothetical protein
MRMITLLLQGHSEVEIHLKCTSFFEYEIHHVTVCFLGYIFNELQEYMV